MRNIKTLSELEDKYIGKKGTSERTAYEAWRVYHWKESGVGSSCI